MLTVHGGGGGGGGGVLTLLKVHVNASKLISDKI